MIGVIISSFSIPKTIDRRILVGIAVAVLLLLGVRTAIRGPNWSSPYTISSYEIIASPSDYNAQKTIAGELDNEGKYIEAVKYAQQSINIFPTSNGYDILGVALEDQGDYSDAMNAYLKSIVYTAYDNQTVSPLLYENLGLLVMLEKQPSVSIQFLEFAIKKEPRDSLLWTYLAVTEFANNNISAAKRSISEAVKYGPVSSEVYYGIEDNQTFTLDLNQIHKAIQVN